MQSDTTDEEFNEEMLKELSKEFEGLEDLFESGDMSWLEEFEKDMEHSGEENLPTGMEDNFSTTFEAVFEQAFGLTDISVLGSELA